MAHLNIEFKARCNNSFRVREMLRKYNAEFKGEDHQIDTYFNSLNGRLKLREGDIENSLISYQRNDQSGPKQSDVILLETMRGSSLKQILTRHLGVKVVVDKLREIYFIDNVKFHLDQVKDLGSFVEVEAIDLKGTIGPEKLLIQCNFYLNAFGISEKDTITNSYSDMLLERVSG